MFRHPVLARLTLLVLSMMTTACEQAEPVEPLAVERGGEAPASAGDPFAALDRFAETLRQVGATAREAGPSRVPFGRSEGALHVLRLMRRAIDEELAWADTRHPYFQAQDERFAKLALGNPDNLYLMARCDDDAVYRIRGRRGSTADFTIQVYQGYPGIHRPFAARGSIGLDRLQVDAQGRFEVHVGGPPRPGNWLDASGAPEGQMLLRWQRVGELGPEHEPRVELVDFDALASYFPDDEPRFGAEDRRRQIGERQAAIERRYGLTRR